MPSGKLFVDTGILVCSLDASDLVNRITTQPGPGHSCGIHTANEPLIVARQPQCLANSRAWIQGRRPTSRLFLPPFRGTGYSKPIVTIKPV